MIKSAFGFLRIPVGFDSNGRIVAIDLNERGQGGDGPHMALVGPTGLGKSVVAQTMAVVLAATHDPRHVHLAILDWNEGAGLKELGPLPHVSQVVTNVKSDSEAVYRLFDSLDALRRDQQAQIGAGSIYEYNVANPEMRLPHWVVFVDELQELVLAYPDAAQLLAKIAREGRKAGIHLVLISQERVRLSSDSDVNIRLAIRMGPSTAPTVDQGPPVAAGIGQIEIDDRTQRFKAATARLPLRRQASRPIVASFGGKDRADEPTGQSELDALVEKLSAASTFKAPLVARPPLRVDRDLSDFCHENGQRDTLAATVGELDCPGERLQEPFTIELSAAYPSLAVVGASGAGVGNFLSALVGALSLRHPPDQCRILAVDMGAQLHFLDELPHVTVCPAVRPDLVGLAVREADHACLARAELMRRHDANSIGDLRARSHLLNAQQGDLASIVLIINGWFTFAEDYPEEASSVTRLAADGSQFGVHVVIGSHRWADLRGALAENVARRLELRLPDPGQSMSWRAEQIRIENSPTGRGIAGKGLWFQTAAARWGADDRNAARLIEKVADKWVDRPRPMPLHILPERLDAGELPDDLGSITIGSTEGRAEAAWLDVFGREPHLLIFGDGNCGKTNALALVTQRMTRASARPVEVWVVDPDQRHDLMSLIGRVPASHRAILKSSIADLVGELAVELEGREALAAAAWEEKTEAAYPSEILLLVDDHHLIQVGANGPLAALSHFAAMRNLGFHIALARRANGAARVTTDPFIARLVEAGTPMLLMNGPASEPPISGSVRFRPQPVGRGMLVRSDNVWGIVQTATGVSLSAARRPATRRQSTRRKAD